MLHYFKVDNVPPLLLLDSRYPDLYLDQNVLVPTNLPRHACRNSAKKRLEECPRDLPAHFGTLSLRIIFTGLSIIWKNAQF